MRSKLLVGSLVLFCAVAISAIAAYFSVVGLAALFAAAVVPVAIMGVVLEGSKLVAAGWLHSNWKNPLVTKAHKAYLCAAVVALMLITSMGIYGYLMKAHLDQKAPAADITMQIEGHQTELDQLIAQRTELERQQANINKTVDSYLESGQARGASSFMRQQQRERDRISGQITALNGQITAKNVEMAPLRRESNAAEAKLGPLKFMGFRDPTKAVIAVIAVLMFAFDPLAVVMMISGTITLKEWLIERRRRFEMGHSAPEVVQLPPPPEEVEEATPEEPVEAEDGMSWPEALEEVGAPSATQYTQLREDRPATPSIPVRSLPEVVPIIEPLQVAEPEPEPAPEPPSVAELEETIADAEQLQADYRARFLELEEALTAETNEPFIEDDLEQIDNKDLLVAILESDPDLLQEVISAVKETTVEEEKSAEERPIRQWLEPKDFAGGDKT